MNFSDSFTKTLQRAQEKLESRFYKAGFYESRLSSSALSTCLAVYALALKDRVGYSHFIEKGLDWLMLHSNKDGGWGDTIKSPTNLSTTLLVWSVFSALKEEKYEKTIENACLWLKSQIGDLKNMVPCVLEYYGKDRTFSAPILTVCALSGVLGKEKQIWNKIPQLPFELAVLPGKWFRFLGLQVVSYAIPALVAIGLVHHRMSPSSCWILKTIRNACQEKVLDLLERLQPASGGFLEAIPLTAFVVISLIHAQIQQKVVIEKGIAFLLSQAREDGSWAIDSNLNTWVSSLAVNALPEIQAEKKKILKYWFLQQQFQKVHPFTLSPPGGWGWTDLPGSLPDGDDTSGVLLALHRLWEQEDMTSIENGISWLLKLQNSDGGMPTFCRGWSKMPFDKSCPDITAHALCAFMAWKTNMPLFIQKKIEMAVARAISFLQKNQNPDGSWFPLWFGNALSQDMTNPVYGTSKVVCSLGCFAQKNSCATQLWAKGCEWLLSVQNQDGGWGGGKNIKSSIEETALAIKALLTSPEKHTKPIFQGIEWLIENTKEGENFDPSPLGLYFSQLWYFEELYPLLFTISAMEEAKQYLYDLCQLKSL